MASADGSIEFQTNDFADIFAVAAEDQRQAGVWRNSDTSKFDVVHEESAFEPPTEDMISANKKSLGPGDMTREWVYAALKDKTGLELKGPQGDNVTFWVETTTLELAKDLQKPVSTCGFPRRIREKS